MRYVISDIHGEYELFRSLLDKIGFSDADSLYVCGDIIDKGEGGLLLLRELSSRDNVYCILGNHELAFLNYYHSMLESSPKNFDEVLERLGAYFGKGADFIDWETVDWLERLPSYIEEDDFICVHAGVPTDDGGYLCPLDSVETEELVYDRRFKSPDLLHKSPKCVFFGHTETECVCGENRILTYSRCGDKAPKTVKDYYKIHLDTGAWHSGVLGCFCIDTLTAFYVEK